MLSTLNKFYQMKPNLLHQILLSSQESCEWMTNIRNLISIMSHWLSKVVLKTFTEPEKIN